MFAGSISPFTRLTGTLIAVICFALFVPSANADDTAPDTGDVFDPKPTSAAVFDFYAPTHDASQRHYETAQDGTKLYVETYLPAPKGGVTPPAKLPTILFLTAYSGLEQVAGDVQAHADFGEYLARRGYAVSIGHLPGTGNSGGCLDLGGPKEVAGSVAIVRYIVEGSSWSDGTVGLLGISYDASAAINLALADDPVVARSLKAIVPVEGTPSSYPMVAALDGVPLTGAGAGYAAAYLPFSVLPSTEPSPDAITQRPTCQPEHVTNGANLDVNGNFNDYWREREGRLRVDNLHAALLQFHGLVDTNVNASGLNGWFARLPEDVPHKLVLGQWDHGWPDKVMLHPTWQRADFRDMVLAWFDRYLKGSDTAVEEWPTVQIQDSSGQWRSEKSWPRGSGDLGQLALSAGGVLGSTAPTGTSAYIEVQNSGLPAATTFTTPPLTRPLHITGQPVLDLWASLSYPDAHVSARLDVVDAEGNVLPGTLVYGARSARHLDPIPDDFFVQDSEQLPATDQPIHIPIRLMPADLIVPAGMSLRVSVSGTISDLATVASNPVATPISTEPSGAPGIVTILHDCAHQSVLRFEIAPEKPSLLNVREPDEAGSELLPAPWRRQEVDGGLARNRVCGAKPSDPQLASRL